MEFYVTIKKNKARSICFKKNRLPRDGKKVRCKTIQYAIICG